MQNFSEDLCMQYANFKIDWHVVAEDKSDGTSVKEYEAKVPVKRWKYHKRVVENANSCKAHLTASFS